MKPEVLRVLELDAQGLGMSEIVKITGSNYGAVGSTLSRHRIEYWENNYPDRIEQIIEKYEELGNANLVSKLLGYSHTLVTRVVHGKVTRPRLKRQEEEVAKRFNRRCSKCLGVTQCGISTDCCEHCKTPF